MQFSLKRNATCSVQSVINTAHMATHIMSPRTYCTRVPTNWIFKTDEDAARTATRALFIHQRCCWDFGTARPTVFTTLQCPLVQLSSKKSDVSSLPPSVVPSVESIKQSTPVWARNLVPSYKMVPKTGTKWTWGAGTESARYWYPTQTIRSLRSFQSHILSEVYGEQELFGDPWASEPPQPTDTQATADPLRYQNNFQPLSNFYTRIWRHNLPRRSFIRTVPWWLRVQYVSNDAIRQCFVSS
jgi:hypothetical protein